jgi:hypothetical protein
MKMFVGEKVRESESQERPKEEGEKANKSILNQGGFRGTKMRTKRMGY